MTLTNDLAIFTARELQALCSHWFCRRNDLKFSLLHVDEIPHNWSNDQLRKEVEEQLLSWIKTRSEWRTHQNKRAKLALG